MTDIHETVGSTPTGSTMSLAKYLLRNRTKEIVDEFIRLFPDRCMICSYHRYGICHGHTIGPVPEHDCKWKQNPV